MLGNDIVDIGFCEQPKRHHVRYLDRVCTPEEADAVRRSVNPVRALALLWVSKEAAYKLFSKQLTQCYFVPSEFVIQIEGRDPVLPVVPVAIDQKLSILYEGVQIEVSILAEEKWVHAVAASPVMKVHWTVREIERCFLGSRKASGESEAVRFLANELLDELGLEDVSLQFDGRVPKLKGKGGVHTGMDISLAHHGAFAAVAIAGPACRPGLRHDVAFAGLKSWEAVCSTCTA